MAKSDSVNNKGVKWSLFSSVIFDPDIFSALALESKGCLASTGKYGADKKRFTGCTLFLFLHEIDNSFGV
ncbi:hypothetical protein NBG4_300008 [Candidatus Sulfobium mesophilum]|uniref:Uncharacterized protein n=1 Tax=Candidatus Sulfobium mesophilum TaxID=2016548 RepID=A0A2U3QH21_9BACT|nr:hypothetical protein NBG4_300008 [Candidatus Sulfobium mesophilum]